MTALSINNLTKRYGGFTAVDGLSVDVEPASVCGLLGPNGSGKSTTFKCVLGLARPTSGSVTIEGSPLRPETFEYLAYVPEKSALYEWMTVEQHLEMARRAYRQYDVARGRELLALFKLPPKKLVRRLSKGQQTAVALVIAFAIRPRVLVLDEPASGLDPVFQRTVLDLIIDAAAGGAGVLFSSHQIGQVERAADRIAVLRDGKLVLAGNIDTLKGDEKVVVAAFDAMVPEMPELERDPNVRRIERGGRIVRLYTDGESDRIAGKVAQFVPRSLEVVDLTLEDIFLGAVGDGVVPPIGVES